MSRPLLRPLLRSALACALLLGGLATPASAASAAASPASPGSPAAAPTPAAQAAGAAAAFVARRPAVVHPGAGDVFTAGATTAGSGGLHYTAYTRRYRGLPVLGGDFVVVTDARGAVAGTSVGAQREPLALATAAILDVGAAAAIAGAQLVGGTVQRTTKVIDAWADTPTIAYESLVTGARRGVPSRLHVLVDAGTGAVLDSWDEVVAGTGTGAYNGPSPLAIATSGSDGAYTLADPGRPGVRCGDFVGKTALTGADDVWGDGDAATIETGCVDALYDVAHEWDMLGSWLGRNGIDGSGHGFPVYVGLDDRNAYWDGSAVSVGHNAAGGYLAAQDVVGHEFGHAVDSTTAGGAAGNGVSEATGDIFGTALEFYDDQDAAYDPPDWTIGEEVDLDGTGPIRDMADPGTVGDPTCWSSAIPRTETHAAAGPFDHWFYLVAGGQAGAGGTTVSRCNGATVTGGLGVQAALQVFYQAMLAKTTRMNYQRYRSATLLAAKNLHPGSCDAFATVLAAWNAVQVPAQAADPTCASPTSVVVDATGAKSGTAGVPVTPFTVTAQGGDGTYAWSARGLPPGVTIGAATGTVSGTPTRSGTFTVTVTAASNGAGGTTRFTFTVSPAGTGCTAGQLLADPGFEAGGAWTTTAGVVTTGTDPRPAHGGTRLAYLDGYGRAHTDTVSQAVTVPAGCRSVTVSFWLEVASDESAAATPSDTLAVKYGTKTIATFSDLDRGGTYVQRSFAVSTVAQTVTLKFTGKENDGSQTSFLLDDVAVTVG